MTSIGLLPAPMFRPQRLRRRTWSCFCRAPWPSSGAGRGAKLRFHEELMGFICIFLVGLPSGKLT